MDKIDEIKKAAKKTPKKDTVKKSSTALSKATKEEEGKGEQEGIDDEGSTDNKEKKEGKFLDHRWGGPGGDLL